MTRMLCRVTRRVECLLAVIALTAVALAGAQPASADPVVSAVSPQRLQPEFGTTVFDWTTFPDGSSIPNDSEITDQFAAWGVIFDSPPGPPQVLAALDGILVSGGPTGFFGDISMSFPNTGRESPTSITVEIIGSGLNIGATLEGFAGDGSSLGVVTHTYSGPTGQLSAFTLEAPTGTKIASALFNGALNPSAAASIGTLILRWPLTVPLTVPVDVRPGSRTNSIEFNSKGSIPVAILGREGFDTMSVDPGSVCFGDADNASQRDCTALHARGFPADLNRDGRRDLLLLFQTQETGIDAGDKQACLTGKARDGTLFEGCDLVTVR